MRLLRGFAAGVCGTLGMAGASFTMRRFVQPTAPIGKTHYENVVEVAHARSQPDAPPLDRDLQIRLAEVAHLAFGGFWGVVWAMLRRDRRIRPMMHGAAFGTIVWALAFGAYMPALRLARGLWQMDLYELTRTWVSHVAFGVVTSLVLGSRRRR